jgi:hypothetical protein
MESGFNHTLDYLNEYARARGERIKSEKRVKRSDFIVIGGRPKRIAKNKTVKNNLFEKVVKLY